MRKLNRAQARRVALAAQGFGSERPAPKAVGIRQVQRVIDRVALFQIDSINIVVRAHRMPLFSRLGAYDPALLRRAFEQRPRRLFEYWGHEASLIDIALVPALRWRMASAGESAWGSMRQIAAERPDLVEKVLDELATGGARTARELSRVAGLHVVEADRGHWGWNWSGVKTSLEWLFYCGRVSAVARNSQFERIYDLAERVWPPAADLPAPAAGGADASREEQIAALVSRSARALGVASQRCLADYFRLSMRDAAVAIEELVRRGDLVPVAVAGWHQPTWLWHEASVPRSLAVRALVSPFDSLVFERNRLLELFDCHYRIEIYVPQADRQFGYYVYLFVLGDRIRARVDLKAARDRGVLVVKSAWFERAESWPAEDQLGEDFVARELLAELRLLADWQGLSDVEVHPVGSLAPALASALGRAPSGS